MSDSSINPQIKSSCFLQRIPRVTLGDATQFSLANMKFFLYFTDIDKNRLISSQIWNRGTWIRTHYFYASRKPCHHHHHHHHCKWLSDAKKRLRWTILVLPFDRKPKRTFQHLSPIPIEEAGLEPATPWPHRHTRKPSSSATAPLKVHFAEQVSTIQCRPKYFRFQSGTDLIEG